MLFIIAVLALAGAYFVLYLTTYVPVSINFFNQGYHFRAQNWPNILRFAVEFVFSCIFHRIKLR